MARRSKRTWQKNELDSTLKAIARVACQDLVNLAARGRPIRILHAVDKEIQVQGKRLDELHLAEEDGVRYLLHQEFKSRPSATVAEQVAADACLAHFLIPNPDPPPARLPVHTIVFFVDRAPGRRARSDYRMTSPRGGSLVYTFEAVKVYEEVAASHLASRVPGIMPLVPLMAGATPEMTREACEVILALPEGDPQRSELAAAAFFIAGKAFPGPSWSQMIGEEVLMESVTYRATVEKGRKQGQIEGRKEGELKGRKEGELKGRKEGELKGRKEGELKGRKEGELRGRRDAVIELLEARLHDVPRDIVSALRSESRDKVIGGVLTAIATVRDDDQLLAQLRVLLGS